MKNDKLIILPRVVTCSSKSVKLPVINCNHWGINTNCSTECNLNIVKYPDYKTCMNCPSRSPVENIDKKFDEIKKQIETEKIFHDHVMHKEKINANPKKEYEKNFLNLKNKKEKTFLQKAKSYLTAESSQVTQGKISKENFEKRKEICMACEYRVNDIKKSNVNQPLHDSIGWCKGGCGCSVGAERAALSVKLYMPTLSCPKNKFGIEKGAGFEISDAFDSAKGIIKSVVDVFKKEETDK